MKTFNTLKQSLAKEYDTKDLGDVKTIIGWQIKQDTTASIIKIYQSAFIRDLVIKEKLTNCNANIILMKTGSSIKMSDLEDYEKTDFYTYQRLVKKLIYFLYDTRLDISFIVR